MPYIKQSERTELNELWKVLNKVWVEVSVGSLNFILTKICKAYVISKGAKYSTYNDVIGALECCKLEFTRRNINPYEDIKIKENGDV